MTEHKNEKKITTDFLEKISINFKWMEGLMNVQDLHDK